MAVNLERLKMNRILLFDELEARALKEDNFVLFGESGFVHDRKACYDILFYGENVKNPYDVKWPVSMAVPVLNLSKRDSPIVLAGLNKEHPSFNRFGVVNDSGLRFYDVFRNELGARVTSADLGVPHLKYVKTSKSNFLDYINNPAMNEEIGAKISEIDKLVRQR